MPHYPGYCRYLRTLINGELAEGGPEIFQLGMHQLQKNKRLFSLEVSIILVDLDELITKV